VADMMHKLATFILNNPPDAKGGIQEKSSAGKKTKEDRKAEKAAKKKKGKDESEEEEEEEEGQQSWDKRNDKMGDAADKAAAAGANADDDDDDDDDWAVDVSDAAVKAREDQAQASFDKIEAAMSDTKIEEKKEKKEKKSKDKKKDDDDDFGPSPMEEQMAKIRASMTPALDKSEAGATDEAVKMLGAVAKENDLKPNDLFGFIFESFDENAVKQLGSHTKLLTKLFKAAPDQKKSQAFLLTCVANLACGEHKDALMKKTPILLKKLYDIDMLEEKTIVEWHDKGSKKKDGKAVREAAAPFVNWLKEADEDSDEDSDDEE